MKEPKRILIVRTDRIGDMVLSTPVIENLRKAFPRSYIAFMCRPYTKDILEGNPYLDEVIVYDKYAKHKSLLASLKFSYYLRKKRFDWAIVLHPTNRAHLVTFLANIGFRVGWDRKLSFLLTRRLPHKKHQGLKHELEYSLDMLESIGVEVKARQPFIPRNEAIDSAVDSLLKDNMIDYRRDRIVGLGIGASCPSKIWKPEYFAEVGRRLKAEGAKIIVLAQEHEKDLTRQFKEHFKDDFCDLTGKLDLARISSLFRKISLFIGNDSGLIHIAWAVGAPVISLFGRNNPGLSPTRWGPRGERSFFFHGNVGCGDCLAHNCEKELRCLDVIKPEEVFEKAVQILKH